MAFAYYNEFKPEAVHMLRQLIKDGLIADGVVDERSITEVSAEDVKEFTQCHFFAGIGGWSVALRMAGWPDDRPVWTGSCPCQPFSTAGKQKGKADERHLWPVWFRLIRESKPATVFGEQVAAAITYGWWDDVATDMETEGYACGAAVLPACSVGKPHKRDRLWFVANASRKRVNGKSGQFIEAFGRPARLYGKQPKQPSNRSLGSMGDTSGAIRQRGTGGFPAPEEGECGAGQQNGNLSQRLKHAGQSRTLGYTEHDGLPLSAQLQSHEASSNEWREEEQNLSGQSQGAGRPIDVSSILGGTGGEQQEYVANPNRAGLQGHRGHEQQHGEERRQESDGYPREADLQWISCPDGKSRPVEPGIRLLAHGIQHRAPVLHAFGNAIVPSLAAEFIKAFIHVRGLDLV